MNKPKTIRKVNRNLFYSKLALNGMSLSSLGKTLSPPIGKVGVWNVINRGSPDIRLKEIAAILKTNVPTLFPKIA
jgi:hypothetical protein